MFINTTQQRKKKIMNRSIQLLSNHSFWIGLNIRLFVAFLLPYLLDDARWIPGVAYTDIDYYIFTDAAQHVVDGQSPYDRHTYRYTPFLAVILSFYIPFTRTLFCIADAFCGSIIVRLRRRFRKRGMDDDDCILDYDDTVVVVDWDHFQDTLWWAYNPFAINICTRGSAESLMVLLPVLVTVSLVTSSANDEKKVSSHSQRKQYFLLIWRAFLAGLLHGIAIHSKLYPIIYSLSYMCHFGVQSEEISLRIKQEQERQQSQSNRQPQRVAPPPPPRRIKNNVSILSYIRVWFYRLALQPAPILFFIAMTISFVGITYLGYELYGTKALEEGLFYHFSRVDHRHNYSMFWYMVYLAKADDETWMDLEPILGRILFLPQVVLLFYSSLEIAPHDLGLSLFIQTYLFVILNKVITAQYFTWYLCLLPLCSHHFQWNTKKVKYAVGFLILTILHWLLSAYCLEIRGLSCHRWVWVASILYFCSNVNLFRSLLDSYQVIIPKGITTTTTTTTTTTSRPKVEKLE